MSLHSQWPCLSPSCPKALPIVPTEPPIPVNPSLLPQLCANLDTWRIMSSRDYRSQLQHNRQPCKQYDLCHRRTQVRGGRAVARGGVWCEVRAPGVEL